VSIFRRKSEADKAEKQAAKEARKQKNQQAYDDLKARQSAKKEARQAEKEARQAEKEARQAKKEAELIESLQSAFVEDERLECWVKCDAAGPYRGALTESKGGTLAATNRRLLFRAKWGGEVETIPYRSISSVRHSIGITGGELVLQVDGKKRQFDFVEPKERTTEMAKQIEGKLF
jgi:hypothetical protein